MDMSMNPGPGNVYADRDRQTRPDEGYRVNINQRDNVLLWFAQRVPPAGVDASPGPLQRRALEPAGAAARSGRGEVLDARPLEPRMYLSIDGTGVPMRREEVAGVAGRQADGTPRTREAKPAVVYSAEGRDPGTGALQRFTPV